MVIPNTTLENFVFKRSITYEDFLSEKVNKKEYKTKKVNDNMGGKNKQKAI